MCSDDSIGAQKACMKCGEVKPLGEYYRHAKMADGHLNKCKECTRRDVTEHRMRNIERIREYDRVRGRTDHRRASNARSHARLVERDPSLAAERKRTYVSRYNHRFPEKRVAHVAVGNAIRDGRMQRLPCERCGSPTVDAHHDDYSEPLNVRWLCRRHHMDVHIELREQGRDPDAGTEDAP